jgi:DNA-binding transcriptional regulator GbsR (MarR family)
VRHDPEDGMGRRGTEWFVEEMGLTTEADGFTRIAGRLFGHLLLAAGPQSLDDIAAALGVSKASVSTDARRLLEKGVIERTGLPGDRRDYYRVPADFFERLMRYRVERWRRFHDLTEELRRAMPRQDAAVRARLRYIDEVYGYVAGRLDDALSAWHARATRAAKPRARAKSAARSAQR